MNSRFLMRSALVASLSGLWGSAAHADVKLSGLFADNMVLQRNQSVPVCGTADPNEAVTVQLGADNSARATAGADGKWKVSLAPQSAASSLTLTVKGKNTLVLNNVAVGEVWLCSGQSNMEFVVSRLLNAGDEIQAANNPDIRLLTVGKASALTPQGAFKGSWMSCSPQTVGNFSAVAYFFGRELQRKLGVPVGLICSSWGGTVAEAWTSREALESVPELKPIVAETERRKQNYPADKEKYEKETLPAWQAAADAAKAAGNTLPNKPGPVNPPTDQNRSSNLFNGMIAPLVPYGIKGVIWYQGESNSARAVQYRTLFPTLIRDWRAQFGQGNFPFYWVQLANYRAVQTAPVEMAEAGKENWPLLREAQTLTLALPNTGLASAIDLADADKPGDIHPHNKQEVGRRLAAIALAKDYGQPQTYSGPMFAGMVVRGTEVHLSFNATDGGLKAKGEKLMGFAVKGANGDWKWADAALKGNTVVVLSAEVSVPVAVRYDWASNPVGNLYNGAGFPALPFRSDMGSAN